ncbi:hypothetical protein [Flavobacterium sp. CGRL2]
MKIINPIIDPKIQLPSKSALFSSSFYTKTIPSTAADVLEPVEFIIEKARSVHTFWIKQICEVTLSSAIARGTGISQRSPEMLEAKMKKRRSCHRFCIRWQVGRFFFYFCMGERKICF